MARLTRKQQPKKSILERFDTFIGKQIDKFKPAPGKVTPQAVAKEALRAPKIVANKTTPTLLNAVKPIRERVASIARSIQTRSTKPFKESYNAQVARLKTPQGTIDAALSFTGGGKRITPTSKSALVKKPGIVGTIKNFFRPAESIIERQGPAGKTLKQTLTRGIDKGEVEAGKRVFEITKARLGKLSKAERINLLDTLEGRAKPLNQKVREAFRITRTQTDELANYAKNSGVLVKRRVEFNPNDDTTKFADESLPKGLTPLQQRQLISGKRLTTTVRVPFEAKQNFFPHKIPSVDDIKGSLEKDIAENIVRLKIKPNIAEANIFIKDYKNFIETGGKQESLIKYMVDSGQSKDAAEAFSNLQRYRTRTIKRSGSLEYSREIDLPFYDPDPARVIPRFVAESAARIEHIRAFKQDQQIINNLILKIRNTGGDADTVRTIVDRSLGIINDSQTAAAKVSRMLRLFQGFKLGLAVIPNSVQGVLNSLLAADLKAVGAGIFGVMRSQGRAFALRSGATLDSTLNETIKESGALSKFLKATGFTATERMNRTLAANAGKSYGTRLLKKVLTKPNDKNTRRLLQEFGVNVDDVITRGVLNEDDVLMFAKKFTDITQFRSRPQDLPLFASSPSGKVFFQFKNYIYGQTRLLHRELIGELKNKQFGRATRNVLILATVFPLVGEVVADVRSLVTDRKRESKGLERYFENIAQTGAMGILLDTLQAGKYGRGAEFIAGPTVSDAGELINALGSDNKKRNLGKFITKRVPIVGNRLSGSLFPTTETKPKQTRRKLR